MSVENLQNARRLAVLTMGVINTAEECVVKLKRFMEPEQVADASMRMARAHADIKEIHAEISERLEA